MKTLKLTALIFLFFSGVFGVSVFHHHLLLNADSKVTGYVVNSFSTPLNLAATLDKTTPPLDDNDLLTDDSLDDDDDGFFSAREKNTPEASCIDSTHYYSPYHSSNDLQFRSYRTNFYYPHCSFISLRVFRL